MLTVKILLNSVISTKGAKFMIIAIKASTSAHPWNDPSSCNLNLLTCQRMPSLATISMLSNPLMALCMFISRRACMAFHKQESLHKTYWRIASMPRSTIKAQSHLVPGDMAGDPSPLPYV
ncbi:hypothetical protein ACHAW6_010006 [Cyclotella cf. meneghiniana]